jgi:uncharacterized protein YdaU (DUF1376 family)
MAGARPDTWMPLYIGDYLADTMHLSHAQHGIYLLLIMAYWRNGGPLPDDAGQLSAIARCSAQEWRKNIHVTSRFFHIEGGLWSHKRIDAELDGATTKTQERSKAGSEGARRRWQNGSKSDGKAMAEPIANALQNDAPSPSPEEEDSEAIASGAEAPADPVKALWGRGLAILGEGQRALLGKMRNTYTDPVVLAAIVSCENECPSEPAAFFVACCERSKANGKGSTGHANALDTLARAAIEFDERQDRGGFAEAPH